MRIYCPNCRCKRDVPDEDLELVRTAKMKFRRAPAYNGWRGIYVRGRCPHCGQRIQRMTRLLDPEGGTYRTYKGPMHGFVARPEDRIPPDSPVGEDCLKPDEPDGS